MQCLGKRCFSDKLKWYWRTNVFLVSLRMSLFPAGNEVYGKSIESSFLAGNELAPRSFPAWLKIRPLLTIVIWWYVFISKICLFIIKVLFIHQKHWNLCILDYEFFQTVRLFYRNTLNKRFIFLNKRFKMTVANILMELAIWQ